MKTIEEVYGMSLENLLATVPKEYVIGTFRYPAYGELFLGSLLFVEKTDLPTGTYEGQDMPRLILHQSNPTDLIYTYQKDVKKEIIEKEIVSLTPFDIYGRIPKIPEGYEVCGFGPPKIGQLALATDDWGAFAWEYNALRHEPRLLLRLKTPKPRKYTGTQIATITIADVYEKELSEIESEINSQGYEIVRFDTPKDDEMFWSPSSWRACHSGPQTWHKASKRLIILKIREKE